MFIFSNIIRCNSLADCSLCTVVHPVFSNQTLEVFSKIIYDYSSHFLVVQKKIQGRKYPYGTLLEVLMILLDLWKRKSNVYPETPYHFWNLLYSFTIPYWQQDVFMQVHTCSCHCHCPPSYIRHTRRWRKVGLFESRYNNFTFPRIRQISTLKGDVQYGDSLAFDINYYFNETGIRSSNVQKIYVRI